ncbi:MAG: winged helix-turn-helix domain-containing protein [Candidatus Woesearchaeota archaeon]
MKKRDRLEVIHDILRIIKDHNNSIRPTPLLRFSNLSSQSFADYMAELMDKGLVKVIKDKKGKKFITLTDNGFEYLDRYSMIKGFISDFNL